MHLILAVVLRTAGKKKRNVSLWKANIQKKARTEGREYLLPLRGRFVKGNII